jgi:hypothetical protein
MVDKSKASLIYGVPGVAYKVNGKRYNANWKEMEFVSHGKNEGDRDVYRPKQSEEPVGVETVEVTEGSTKTVAETNPDIDVVSDSTADIRNDIKFSWNMKKSDAIHALDKLHVVFAPEAKRMTLVKQLKTELEKRQDK